MPRGLRKGKQVIAVAGPGKVLQHALEDAAAVNPAGNHSLDVFHHESRRAQPVEDADVFPIQVVPVVLFRHIIPLAPVPGPPGERVGLTGRATDQDRVPVIFLPRPVKDVRNQVEAPVRAKFELPAPRPPRPATRPGAAPTSPAWGTDVQGIMVGFRKPVIELAQERAQPQRPNLDRLTLDRQSDVDPARPLAAGGGKALAEAARAGEQIYESEFPRHLSSLFSRASILKKGNLPGVADQDMVLA